MKKSALLGMCLLFLFLLTSPALAHATLIKSTPAEGEVLQQNPGTLRLQFNEPLEPELIELKLYRWDAKELDLSAPQLTKGNASETYAALPDGLEEGSYRLLWSIISEDGHRMNGEISFALGQESETITPITESTSAGQSDSTVHSVLRMIAEGVLLIASGLYLLSTLAQRMSLPSASELLGRFKQIGWALLLALTVGEGVSYLYVLQKDPFTFFFAQGRFDILLETPFLRMALIQLLLLLLIALPGMIRGWTALMLGLITLNLALSGHALAIEPTWLSIALRMMHLLSIALWLGGICYLLLLWRKQIDKSRSRAFFLRAFLIASLAVALTGVLMVSLQTDWSALFTASGTWSSLLFSKIGLMLIMLLLALRQSSRWRKDPTALSVKLLRIEWLIGLLVILAGIWMSLIAYP
ncbi:copper resistance protein CopC [Tumebacillus lipolyticus]|uniref:Copper resistance protein CopC n=1 Tax=Tumebacillus lipolyticus TaxID=1280370 RepID=A0ABW4ZUX7_9BACL